jgi:hypothetical protein
MCRLKGNYLVNSKNKKGDVKKRRGEVKTCFFTRAMSMIFASLFHKGIKKI